MNHRILVVTPREHVRLSAALIHYRNAYLLFVLCSVLLCFAYKIASAMPASQ